MDKGAWRAAVHGVERVRHDLATKPPPPRKFSKEGGQMSPLRTTEHFSAEL